MHQNIQSRITRLLVFILLGFIVVRYLTGIPLSDLDQTKIVFGMAFLFMFLNTYYPSVIIQNDDSNVIV